ncbi:MAG TPA: pilus assembly protein TadG-related protein [Acidimicrobiales bacterium]|nr:pilus assembly protein TadG-related protein [Acidimicrobiales bacterium]
MTRGELRELRDRGFVTAWTVALAGSCWLFVGLALDSGRVLRDRSEAFGAAAAAARAGAQQLDERVAIAEGRTVLDPERASQVAHAYLNDRGFTGEVDVIGDLEVMVTVTETADLKIIPVPDVVTFEVSATAQAVQGTGA